MLSEDLVDTVWSFLPVFGPFLVAVLTAGLGYYFGRKSKFDDIRIERGFNVAEKVVRLFQDVAVLEAYLYKFYMSSFEERENGFSVDLEDAVESFLTLENLYHEQYSQIEKLNERRGELIKVLRDARLYLNHRTIEMINEYIELGIFEYISDGGIMTNTYHQEFFRNLKDPEKHRKREKLQKAIMKRLSKLVT